MDCTCGETLDLPEWTPMAVSAAVFAIAFVITFVCYLKKEAARHKTFYGKEDKISEREMRGALSDADRQRENEMEAAAMGTFSGDVIVKKAGPYDKSPGGGKYKVMMKHRKKAVTPLSKQRLAQSTADRKKTAILPSHDSPYKILLQVDLDKTGRADELLGELKKHEQPPQGEKMKVLESTMESTLEIIERMTRKSFMVVGVMLDGERRRTAIIGQERLEDHADELSLQLKLQLLQPFKALISAYQYEVPQPKVEKAVPDSKKSESNQGQSPEPHVTIQTDVTPQQTPMKSTKRPSSSRQGPSGGVGTPTTTLTKPTRLTSSTLTTAFVKAKPREKVDALAMNAMMGPPEVPPVSPVRLSGSNQAAVESITNEKMKKVQSIKAKTPRQGNTYKAMESMRSRMGTVQPLSTGGSRARQTSQRPGSLPRLSQPTTSKVDSKSKETVLPTVHSTANNTMTKKKNSKESSFGSIKEGNENKPISKTPAD